MTPVSYVLCGTPRTGSTLLCGLLSSTGVLGHPESYFRQPDEVRWAEQFALPTRDGGVLDYGAFVAKARVTGSTPNGVFGGRIMWGSLERLLVGLGRATGASDLAVLEDALGPLAFVHLRRDGLLEQAVSWSRAEQTGYWQEGDAATGHVRLDVEKLQEFARTIYGHNAAWRAWFEGQAIEPLALTYEEVVGDHHAAVTRVADHLSVELPTDWRPRPRERQQADEISAAHVAALREAGGTKTRQG